MSDKLSRRRFLQNTSVVAVGLAAAACGGQATPTKAPAAPAAQPTAAPAAKAPEPTKAPAAAAPTAAPAAKAAEPTKAPAPAAASKYKEAPMLAELVKAGKLPPVDQRLPKNPKVANEMPASQLKSEVGIYGGTMRLVTSVAPDWDADAFVMGNEPIINTPGILGEEVTPNVVEEFKSDDQKTFTFKLREGLKWSDGTPVTTEDVRFNFEDWMLNTEISPNLPTYFRAANDTRNTPVKFEKVDDFTFKLVFDKPYGGFPLSIGIQGWRGYTEIFKPAHFLKQFHKKYADEAKLKQAMTDAKVETWVQLITLKNANNWDLTRKKNIGYPCLFPWLITDVTQQSLLFSRNPYYFKIDTAGQQLPYIDKMASQMVSDIEMVGMKHISGEVDFARESAVLVKMPLYRENEKKANIRALMARTHVTYTDVFLNLTNKDENWRKVTQNVKFRQALNLGIDRKEIIDAVYYGFAEPSTIIDSKYDPAAAQVILDEIGMKKGADGLRVGPDGKVFEIPFECGAQSADQLPVQELFVQFWGKLGLKTSMKRIDSNLAGQRQAANELFAYSIWTHTPLFYMNDWGYNMWGRAWSAWWLSSGKEGEEPPADVKAFYEKGYSVPALPPAEAKKAFEECKLIMKEKIWYFVHIEKQMQPLLVNAKLGNVSESKDAFAIASNFSGEQFFFKA
jgi:peptide/nickel transport system substrate-binding protein